MKYEVKMNDKKFEVEVDRVSPFKQLTREEIAEAAGVPAPTAAPATAAPAAPAAAPAPAAPAAPAAANPMPASGIPMPVPIGQSAPVAVAPLAR